MESMDKVRTWHMLNALGLKNPNVPERHLEARILRYKDAAEDKNSKASWRM